MSLGSPGFEGPITGKSREKLDTLFLKTLYFLFPYLVPSPKSCWESLGQEDLSSHATCQAIIGLLGFHYPLIPILWDFPLMASCHVSTHGPHLSSCLTNSTHDTWHLLIHSNCAKCPALSQLPRKTWNSDYLGIRRNSTKFDVVARFCETIPTVKSVSPSEI